MNKKIREIFNALLFVIIVTFLVIFFLVPEYIGMQQSSQKTRAAIGRFFNNLSNLPDMFTFKDDSGPKKYGEISRETDAFKEAEKRRQKLKQKN